MPSANEPGGRPDTASDAASSAATEARSTRAGSGRFQSSAALVLFGVLFLGVADTQLIPPLLPFMAEDLGISPGRAGTIVTTYALAAAAFALLAGAISDRLGRKRLICLALALFSTASLLTYLVPHFSILLWTRVLTGFGAGALSTLALSYAADLYSYENRGKAMGIISMAYFLAFAVGIPVGAVVAARLGWRWVFVGLSVAGVGMLLITALFLPPDQRRGDRIFPATMLAHLRNRDRLAGIAAAFLTSGGLVGFLTFVGVWLRSSQGIGIEGIGFLFMAAGVTATVASPLSGWLADRIGKRRVIIAANVVLAMMFVTVSGIQWGWALFVGIGLLSVAASARQAPLHALTTELVGPEIRGSYVATRNAASQLGIATLVALSAIAFDSIGFVAVAWIAASVTILIPAVCAFIPEPDTFPKRVDK